MAKDKGLTRHSERNRRPPPPKRKQNAAKPPSGCLGAAVLLVAGLAGLVSLAGVAVRAAA